MDKTKKKFSYSNFHTIVMVIAFTPIALYVFHYIKGDGYGDKLSILIGMAIFAVLQLFVQSRFYKLEKKDEMVQYNLARANRITLLTVLTVLFAAVFVNDYFVKGFICSDFCWITVMAAIALRSFLFMMFDAPSAKDTEEE
ncbi:hypothetical protein SAMN02910265_02600 [Ruminococcus flavefaciens]|uniref:Uncharacterized protein n=1 Tax=Ruminococcus flavefaciens TaxID=1265 RepID=A0A1H6KTI4_RUMFL|nr:hypothetical protein [Ruminococcus flavefaciens]SEH77231.1 hypothetical protein SAMN02910265_02600 [Ruminococcus flavefaciens]